MFLLSSVSVIRSWGLADCPINQNGLLAFLIVDMLYHLTRDRFFVTLLWMVEGGGSNRNKFIERE